MESSCCWLADALEADRSEVVRVLREAGAEVVVNYLPVGSEVAARFYAECALLAGVAFVNCMPVFIASNSEWAEQFRKKGVPVVGDDIKSQVGATIVHRVLTNLFGDRGVRRVRRVAPGLLVTEEERALPIHRTLRRVQVLRFAIADRPAADPAEERAAEADRAADKLAIDREEMTENIELMRKRYVRLQERFNVEVETEPMKVAFREIEAQADEAAGELLDGILARLGRADFRAGLPLRYRVVNPHAHAVTDVESVEAGPDDGSRHVDEDLLDGARLGRRCRPGSELLERFTEPRRRWCRRRSTARSARCCRCWTDLTSTTTRS